MADNRDESIKTSWFNMADAIINKLFLTRAVSVSIGSFSAEEADKFISDKAHEYMTKYENMSDFQLHLVALADMLETLSSTGGGDEKADKGGKGK